MDNAVLQVRNLSVAFETVNGTVPALKNISFTLHKNEVLALVGESGSGKSVTALSILRLLPSPPARITRGEIIFSEENTFPANLLRCNNKRLQQYRGGNIGMIFQEPMTSLNPVFTCGQQVMEVLLQHKKINKEEARQRTLEWFEKVNLPDPFSIFDRYPHQLSGGQKQRVMIAMAMCCSPSLLICDEPTTALDVTVQKAILELIRDLQKQTGMAVIFITHDLGVVAEIADRCAVMYKGEIVEQKPVAELFSHPVHPYTKGLIACRPANHPKGARLPVVSDFLNEVSAAPRPSVKPVMSSLANDSSEVLIDVRELTVEFENKSSFLGKKKGGIKAVNDVSFSVYKGETLGLVGESGCGKTTLGRTLLRLTEPSGGSILYKGEELLKKSGKELKQLRKDIQIIFQDPYSSLNPRKQIGEALMEPLVVHEPSLTRNQRKEKIISLLEKTDLKADHFTRYPHEFSGGQRQRVVIARALALDPSFIVCDESVSALDVSVQAQVLNLLSDLKKEFGFTVIFISHDLSVVHYISDRIMVMNKGRIVESGLADKIYHDPSEPYTQKLIASIPKGFNT